MNIFEYTDKVENSAMLFFLAHKVLVGHTKLWCELDEEEKKYWRVYSIRQLDHAGKS